LKSAACGHFAHSLPSKNLPRLDAASFARGRRFPRIANNR
jgi:hypothetical protein